MIDAELLSTIIRIEALLMLSYGVFRLFAVEKNISARQYREKYLQLRRAIPFLLGAIALDSAGWILGNLSSSQLPTYFFIGSDLALVLFGYCVYRSTSYRNALLHESTLRDRLYFSNKVVVGGTAAATFLLIVSAAFLFTPTTGMAIKDVEPSNNLWVLLFAVSSAVLLTVLFFRKEILH